MSAKFSFTESEIAAQRLIDSKYKEEKWLELEASLTEKFGEKANPLYERLAEYIRRLASYGFVKY